MSDYLEFYRFADSPADHPVRDDRVRPIGRAGGYGIQSIWLHSQEIRHAIPGSENRRAGSRRNREEI